MTSRSEQVARALCRFAGCHEDSHDGGVPTWQSYLPQAQAVIIALRATEVIFAFEDVVPVYPRPNRLMKRVSLNHIKLPRLTVAVESNDRDGGHYLLDELIADGFELVMRTSVDR